VLVDCGAARLSELLINIDLTTGLVVSMTRQGLVQSLSLKAYVARIAHGDLGRKYHKSQTLP
jgi:hypothetical protein